MKLIVGFVVFLVLLFHLVASFPSQKATPRDMCKLPEKRGHCRALLPRWRYNPSTGKCHEFNFGGCDGNENNFTSEKACMTMCSGE
ncbi:hypothetical protein JTB14_018962 [Gonioctena quinquepunctata]|nr:hypothetical protein JTB14_018962 [Gonioctena quinquepunctata]